MSKSLLTGLAIAMLLIAGPTASASAAGTTVLHTTPFGFVVPSTNGWSAEVIGGGDPKSGLGSIGILLRRREERVTYATRKVSFSEDAVSADFGTFGRIEVHSVPTGGTTTERSSCGAGSVTYPSGRWEGTIRFRGDEGFASIDATAGTARIRFLLDAPCAFEVDEGIGGHSPGARLQYERRSGDEKIKLTVRKNRKVGPSRISAELSEVRDGIFIDRAFEIEVGSDAFQFAIPPGEAAVRPPGPFDGTLAFARDGRSRPTLTGDLTVDFPGRRGVRVLGPGNSHAGLVRAVLNPSHPF